ELGVIYVEEANTSHTTGVASYSVTNSGAVDIEGPILKVDNAQRAKCNISSGGTATVNIPETIELCNHKGEYCMPVDLNYNIDEDGKFLYIGADVTVPEGVLNSAIYTGSFGMWYIY
ncbi:MAG: hypothetical protein IJF12_04300, partial [Alphaproteobacteria bacterium]|nr:hypothetical protein [Alphaproteobacteria bacterium]